MDSLTQIVLGAATGEVVLGKKVGNKAMLWGAIAGTIPDLDVFVGKFFHPLTELEIHRGISHSILFDIVMAPLLGWLVYQLYKWRGKEEADIKGWSMLMFWALFTHPLLDCHTTWGTQLFWPLDLRIAYKNIFVVDPLYTVPFIVFLAMAMRLKRDNPKRAFWNWVGIGVSSFYMLITVFIKLSVNNTFEESFKKQNIDVIHYDTKPTPFNAILWSVNAETDSNFYIGYYSLLDKTNDISFAKFDKNLHLLKGWEEEDMVQRAIKISQGYYTVQMEDEELIINDLRFGQIGMNDPHAPFVFRYKFERVNGEIQFEDVRKQNEKEMTAELFSEMMGQLWKRIKGI